MFSGGGFIRGSREEAAMGLILEKYKFDNFKSLQIHIYVPNGCFYLRWADQVHDSMANDLSQESIGLKKKFSPLMNKN